MYDGLNIVGVRVYLVSVIVAHVPKSKPPVVLCAHPLQHLSARHSPAKHALHALLQVSRSCIAPLHRRAGVGIPWVPSLRGWVVVGLG